MKIHKRSEQNRSFMRIGFAVADGTLKDGREFFLSISGDGTDLLVKFNNEWYEVPVVGILEDIEKFYGGKKKK